MFNHKMLILAREARGLSQHELAVKSGIAQATLSRYEHGLLVPANDHMQIFSTVLDFPADFFSQMDDEVVSGIAMHRKKAALTVKLKRKLEATARLRLAGAKLLASEIEYNQDIPPIDFKRIGEDPEYMAQLIRRAWGISRGSIRNLVALVESKGILILRFDFGSLLLDGFVIKDDFSSIVVNSRMPMDRQRFTIAHELGHFFMHGIIYDDSEQEKEAHRFASEFLMPKEDIYDELKFGARFSLAKLTSLKEVWRVSMAALLYRAHDLEVINDPTYRRFITQMSEAGYRRSEPYPLSDETPTLLYRMLEVARTDLEYSDNALQEAMHLNKNDYTQFYMFKPGNQFDVNRSFTSML